MTQPVAQAATLAASRVFATALVSQLPKPKHQRQPNRRQNRPATTTISQAKRFQYQSESIPGSACSFTSAPAIGAIANTRNTVILEGSPYGDLP
jgi:hypothetical protein